MPSSPGYVRNYNREWETAKKRGEGEDNAARHRLRRSAVKRGMVKPKDGKDLDHIKPLSKGGPNRLANARIRSKGANRGFPRNKDGSLKANT